MPSLEALGIECSPFESPAPPPPPPPPPPPRQWPWMPRRPPPWMPPQQVPHAHNTGATFQFHQADHARRHALQRGRARSTNRAAEAALAELRRHQSKLKAAEELCARKDEVIARERREAAAHEAAM